MVVNVNAPSVIIISQDKTVVKTQNSSIIEQNLQKWVEKKHLSKKISIKLRRIGEEKRSIRMYYCADVLEYTKCNACNAWHIKRANLCRDRFCPTCSWRLSLQRFGEMKKLLSVINDKDGYNIKGWSLVTLTVKNCNLNDLSETLDKMSEAWKLTVNQRKLKPCFYGWAKSTELTLNERTREVHPHYHILVAWYDVADKLLIDKWLSACTNKGLTVDIKAQHAQQVNYWRGHETPTEHIKSEVADDFTKAVLETFKYSVKGSDLDSMSLKEFKTVVQQYANKRLISYGGKIKEYVKLLRLNMEEVKDEDIQLNVCRDCGAFELEKVAYKWAFGLKAYVKIDNYTSQQVSE